VITFEVRECYHMPYVSADAYMMGVDLGEDMPSIAALVGTPVKLLYKGRERVTQIYAVSPPLPDHLPPYKRGERIGIAVKIEGA